MRQATRHDKPAIKELMRAFRDESGFTELADIDDSSHLDSLLESILAGQGVVFIEEGKGLIIGLIAGSVWNDKTLIMHELAWYVKPEHRRSSIGYRLLKAYILYGNGLKAQGRIKYFTLSKLDTSPHLKYEKHGFKKKDENWIQ
jgi:N-acetylglutamate synthase-like GNAT family acetyltransferase